MKDTKLKVDFLQDKITAIEQSMSVQLAKLEVQVTSLQVGVGAIQKDLKQLLMYMPKRKTDYKEEE